MSKRRLIILPDDWAESIELLASSPQMIERNKGVSINRTMLVLMEQELRTRIGAVSVPPTRTGPVPTIKPRAK